MSKVEDPLLRIQQELDHDFTQTELLRLALTHPSYAHEHLSEGGEEYHNQRLEFLGDAVLDFLVAAWLYRRFPELPEGPLTRLRATMVCTKTLAQLSRDLALGKGLRLGRGEEEHGGSERPANLCDALEAVVGAFYLDSDLETVWSRLEPWFTREIEIVLEQNSYSDAKSSFQEWAQAKTGITPVYRIVAAVGPEHAKTFTAQVLLEEAVQGEGVGPNKRTAEQAAAEQALLRAVRQSSS
ncbi:MAG TPA: ribonuclease III [Thermoflexia bacterium]|nr:ribonuclease III [Thermoflexia bacterium]